MTVYLRDDLRSLCKVVDMVVGESRVRVVTSGGFVTFEHWRSLMVESVIDYRES
jgi:hypothetical protein